MKSNMGKMLDALLGRGFKASKLKTLAKLAISRIAIFRNQKYVRCSHAKSDIVQLLKLGDNEQALLRVGYLIKEKNMVDAFVVLENCLRFLTERVALLQKNKECPDELKEAILSLIFASSRCAEFPELREIRSIFLSRFGKDFASRAVDVPNVCGVNLEIIPILNAQEASFESRIKMLKDIASENSIALRLDNEGAPEEKSSSSGGLASNENFYEQVEAEKKYRDVTDAALEAFESAAYAAAAARAAVELSRSESRNYQGRPVASSHLQRSPSTSSTDSEGSISREENVTDSFLSRNELVERQVVFNRMDSKPNRVQGNMPPLDEDMSKLLNRSSVWIPI